MAMADERENPWSAGVTADEPEAFWPNGDDDADDTSRLHTGRWMSPSLGAYDPSAAHEALSGGDGADDAYFRDFGYGEGFGDGRLAAGYDPGEPPTPPEPPSADGAGEPGPQAGRGVAGLADLIASGRAGTRPDSSVPPAAEAPLRGGADDPARLSGPAPDAPGLERPAPDRGAGFDAGRFQPPESGRGAVDDDADHDADPFDDMLEIDNGDGADGDDASTGESARRNLIEWGVVLVGAVLLALLLRALVLQAFWIPSPSMETTLLVRDRVLVNKVSYRLHDINRGDVVVFQRTDEEIARSPELPHDVIKRVIALGGETIEIRENQVFIDGLLLQEPYLDDGVFTSDFGPETVPEDHVFVMGDNRELSLDSRFETGPVAEDRVIGRAFFLFWPLGRLGAL
jgi:signal peptidase I